MPTGTPKFELSFRSSRSPFPPTPARADAARRVTSNRQDHCRVVAIRMRERHTRSERERKRERQGEKKGEDAGLERDTRHVRFERPPPTGSSETRQAAAAGRQGGGEVGETSVALNRDGRPWLSTCLDTLLCRVYREKFLQVRNIFSCRQQCISNVRYYKLDSYKCKGRAIKC